MKRFRFLLILFLALWLVSQPVAGLHAQEIKTIKSLPATSVKNQANSGTCWSFATLALIESELLRMGKGDYNFSEMYVARMAYITKAERYLRLQGNVNFGPGGQAHDVFDVWKTYGIVPDTIYTGLINDATRHDHTEMDAALLALVQSLKDGKKGLDKDWKRSVEAILDSYLGNLPDKFKYNGKEYTPLSFSKELEINPADYIEITSFTHHPFYSQFVLEVPDNWASGIYYNIPLDELMQIIEYSINNGYTVAWDGDVSDKGGFGSEKGIASLDNDKKTVTPEKRQDAFDDFSTTDDHLMLITGLGTDEAGNNYYFTKNSWGPSRAINGYYWMSENFIRLKTICIMVNRNAVPDEIAKKMGLVKGK
jgi:bleomycin hydrolase